MWNLFKFILIVLVVILVKNVNSFETTNSTILGRFMDWDQISKSMLDILVLKKNFIAAWPMEMAASLVDIICTSTLFVTLVPPQWMPDIKQINFRYMTPCKNFSVPLLEADKLWRNFNFNKKHKVVILATGWMNTVNSSGAIEQISRAFMCRNDVNFVTVDAAHYVDTLYKWSALNTDLIGEHIAIGLTHLVKLMPLENIHLVGHSLGAHIMGTAGRIFKKLTGRMIPRITGLDPAKPCFRKNQTLGGLSRGDAQFVDIIHTNVGILAKRGPMGDADFYPGGNNPLQPGCITISCSHSRAVHYFAESAYPGQEQNFKGISCNSWQALKTYKCNTYGGTSLMGYFANRTQTGIFYVPVHNSSPFGNIMPSEKNSSNTQTFCYVMQKCPKRKHIDSNDIQ